MLRYMPHFYSQSCCASENGDVMCVLRHTCQMQDKGDCLSEERNEKHKHMNNHCRRFTNEKTPKVTTQHEEEDGTNLYLYGGCTVE